MFKKRLTFMLSAALVLVSCLTPAFASNDGTLGSGELLGHKDKEKSSKIKPDPSSYYRFNKKLDLAIGEPKIESLSTRASNVVVYIVSPCDEEWRSNYGSTWMYEANRAIERGDDELVERGINIDFRSASQYEWDSDDSNTWLPDLIDEAMSEYSLGSNDLLVAFTGQSCFGTGYTYDIGQPYCIIENNGYSTNAETALHEIGHCYGLNHCSNSCVMTASGFGYLDNMCSSHITEWTNARNKY